MSQSYPAIALATDTVKSGITALVTGRTDTLRSSFSGATAPTTGVIGQLWCDTSTTPPTIKFLSATGADVWTRFLTGTTAIADGGTGATTAAGARTNLGLGTAAVANTGTGSGDVPTTTQADARYMRIANNLSELTNPSAARTTLQLAALAQLATVGSAQIDALAVITAKIADAAVTYAKVQAASATSRLLGSNASATGIGEISLGSGLSMSGSTLSATGGGSSVVTIAVLQSELVSTSTDQTVTAFTMNIGANETWLLEYVLFTHYVTSGTTTWTIAVPAGFVSCYWTIEGVTLALPGSTSTATNEAASGAKRLDLSIINGATAGQVLLKFKRQAGTTLTFRAGSYLRATKVA